MLVLTRRVGETLIIGKNGEIKVTVISIKGSQVHIGVLAPDDVPINREEIHQRIQTEKKEEIDELDPTTN